MSATLLRSAGLTGIVLLVVALAPLAGRVESVSAQTATVSAVTVASTSRTAATATATVSGAGTFSLRFSARGENAWGTSLTATATAAGDVTFALTGLAPNDYYDVQVSADSTFATGVVSRTFQNRPAHLDIALAGSNVATGIAGDANTLWVIADGARGATTTIHAYKRTLAAQHGDRDTAKDMTPHFGNHTPGGAWSDGTFLYVVDRSQGRIYVYSLADGSRELSREFRFERGHLDQWGAWANDDTFWVVKRQHDALAYKRPPLSGYMAARDTAKDITLHEHGSYALGGLWSDGETLWAVDGRDRVLYAFDLRLGVPRPHLDVPLNSGHVTAINGLGASGIWGDGEYFWVLDLRLSASKVFTYYQPQPDPSVTELSVVSATSSVVTVRAEMTYPDVSRTVHLRHREPFAATWSTTSGTGGRTIDFVLVRPASAPRLVVQASLDSTFSDGTEVTAELLVRPAQRDFALPGNRTINGIWTDGTTLWVVGEPTLGRSLASGIRLSNQQLVGRFDLESENSAPVGVYATSTHVWVVDAQDKVYVYRIRDGRYESWNSFEIASGNSQLRGAWSNGTTMWIADHVREHVFAYKMGDGNRGAREITKEADLATSYAQPRGMWSNGSTLWVVDAALDRIYAYAISSGGVGGRQPAREVNLVRENGAPWGIAASGNTAWVYDQVKRKVFAYYLPPALGGTITDVQFGEPGVTTASVTVTIANPDSESQTVALKYRAQPDGADQSVSMTTTGASFTFELTGLTPDTLYSLLVTQGADTALHTPGFKTQSEPEQRAHYLKTNVVAVHRADNPWVAELYDQMRRLNLLIRATVGGSQVFLDCRGARVEGLPICDVVSIDIGDGRHRANAGVWLHEMGHVYNAGSRYMGADSEGRGIAWLYFEKLAADGSDCRVHELYADAVESGTVAGSLSNYFPACANTGDTPSAATLALIQSVLAKTMPAWFDTTYEDDTVAYDTSTDSKYDKTYDLEQVWTDLLAMDGWRTSAVFALRNAFGGYCDPIRTIEAQLPSTLNPTRNPWRAGGCVPQPPAAVTLATDGQVTWEAPPYDGGNDLRLYIVEWKDYGEEYDESRAGKVRDLMGTLVYATPATAPGSSVRVSAFSYGGLGEAAEQRQPAAAPGAPAVSAVTAGGGELTVQWSAPASSGGADITSYDVRSILSTASDKADENWDEVMGAWSSGDTAGDLEYTIASLTNGLSYDVEVRAVNSAGAGGWSTTGMVGTPLSSDNTLSALLVSGARLSPTFTSDVISYTASVGNTVTQITVTATENDAGATATLESPADSDPVTAGFQVNLSEGQNDIIIKVTAADGSTRTSTVTVTRTEQVTSLTPPATDPVAPFPSEAAYTLTFQGVWTTAVTPDGVPDRAHFSRLVGAVHNAGVTFLASGGTASAGVESMAETGATATLESEVQTAISAGTARSTFQGSTDDGGVTATQTLNPTPSTAHPRVTLVTMVAPTPDWFVGVSGLPLLNSSGRWLRSHTVNLYPWDAGTEDGTDFSLNNADTDPKVPIHSIRGTGKFSTEPIATLSFELQEVSTTRTVAENTPQSSTIGPPITAAATSGSVTYTLGGADATAFTIVATSGQLRTQAALNYEARDSYEVDVTATDANGSADTRVTVDVTNVDEPADITFTEGSNVTANDNALTVDENHDGRLATFRADDPESTPGLTYQWALEGTDRSHFAITAAGELSFLNIPDYDRPAGGKNFYNITVQATDSAPTPLTGRIAVTVTVDPVDEPPDISFVATGGVTVNDNALTVDENHDGTLATFTASDPENDETLTYEWSTDAPDFVISAAGVLSFADIPDYERPAGGTNGYDIMVSAYDSDGMTGSIAVTVTVDNVEEPPEIEIESRSGDVTVSGSAVSVDENHAGDLVDVTVTDPDGIHTDYTLVLGGTHATSFTLNSTGATGVLSFTNPPDHEAREVYRLTLTASNASESSTLNVTVTVGDVNEPPEITTGLDMVTIEEGSATLVGTYGATDPEGDTIAWQRLEGGDRDEFEFNNSNGRLTFKETPDFEDPDRGGDNEYDVTLGVTAGSALTMFDVTVNVANVEEAGTLALGAGRGVNGEALVATLTDPDNVVSETWQWQHSMSRSGPWTDIANADSNSYTPGADDVGEYLRASVTYTDGTGPDETTLTKATELPTLNDASSNQPPTPPDPLPQVADVPEDAPAGRNVVQVVFTDPEGEQQLTYSLSGSDEFAIGSGSGRITVKSGELNYEATTSYSVTVSAADSYGSAGMVMLTIGISDVDEPPGITLASAAGGDVTVSGSAVSVDENHAGDLVGVTATDPEGIHTDYTLVLGGTHATSFTLNSTGATGVLSFTNPPDHEAREVYRLTLTASNAMESSTLDVTVTVRDVNDPPNIIGMAEFTVNEGHTGLLRTYQKSDPDRPAQTTNWGPVGSSEVLSGTHSDSFVFDLQSGRLTFASAPDFEGGGSQYQVILTANDGKLKGSLDITVNVANLEEQGELTFEGGVTQGANGVPLQATLTDPDGVATQTWVWQRRTGTSGSWTDIDNTNASSYTPTADDVGEYLRARVTYTDGAGTNDTTLTKATDSRTVNDDSGNQPPTPPDPLPQVADVPENASTRRNVVRVVFTDPESERLTYSLVDSDEFAIGSTGQITVKLGAALDHETKPTLLVTVRAADPLGAAGMVMLTIGISDVNEPPTAADLAVRVREDETVDIDVISEASDQDAGDTLTVAGVVRSPGKGGTTVNDVTNDITYTPQANYHGADSFTYRVKDASNLPSNTARVSITVVSVNDAPVFPAATTARSVSESAAEGDSVGAAVTATDIDGDTPTYSLSGTGAFAFEIDSEGQITVATGVTFDIGTQETYTFTVEADDGFERATVEVTITLMAAPVRPPPVGGGGGGGGGPTGPTPSQADFEWSVSRDIEALDSGHDKPSGTWSDGATLWVLENGDGADDAIYAYDLKTGERVEGREFKLDETNRAPRGVWSDRTVLWVSDSGRNRLFAHNLASGERLPERDIAFAERNRAARGIWSDEEAMWVLDGGKDSLFAYDLASGELLAEYALDPTNDDPHGIWSDRVTVWVSNHDPKRLFAYRLPAPEGPAAEDAEPQDLERVSAEEFGELSNASNNSPRGIWSDGEVMYVADESDGKVYSYNMPDAINARLASLTLSGVEIGEFDPVTVDYEGTPGDGVTETTVEAVPAQSGASVAIDPPDSDGEAEGHQVSLDGADITVTVMSPDGSRTRVYRVALEAPPVELALTPAWTAIDWPGAGGVAITEAGLPDAVVAVYRWDEATGAWLTFFPGLGDVPGLNNLNTLSTGATYWVAVSEPVTWSVVKGGAALAAADGGP